MDAEIIVRHSSALASPVFIIRLANDTQEIEVQLPLVAFGQNFFLIQSGDQLIKSFPSMAAALPNDSLYHAAERLSGWRCHRFV